jgi:hypothetical protein
LELSNPRDALAKHVDSDDVAKRDIIDNLGRTQRANHVNESGLYALTISTHLIVRVDDCRTLSPWSTTPSNRQERNMITFYAYTRGSPRDWGAALKATTERAAKVEARKLFSGEHRDATIYLSEMDHDGFKYPVAAAPVRGGRWEPL